MCSHDIIMLFEFCKIIKMRIISYVYRKIVLEMIRDTTNLKSARIDVVLTNNRSTSSTLNELLSRHLAVMASDYITGESVCMHHVHHMSHMHDDHVW